MSESIHQEIVFDAAPARIFDALMQSELHAAFTGGPADIGVEPGSPFSCHGGTILGRTLELVKDQRIVQAWRVKQWPEGVYSLVKLDLVAEGGKTRLVMDHTGVPADAREHLDAGWHARYWEPLKQYLA